MKRTVILILSVAAMALVVPHLGGSPVNAPVLIASQVAVATTPIPVIDPEMSQRIKTQETRVPESAPGSPSVIDPNVTALQIAQAVAGHGVVINGAAFVAVPPVANTGSAVANAPLTFFPQDGSTFGILTNGRATLVDDPGIFASETLQGSNVRGNTDFDVTILRIDMAAPQGANCLSIDLQFLSEEYPRWVGSPFNDAFIAELDQSNWTTSGSTIIAPRNFAFDPAGHTISVNSTGITSMHPANAEGTAFDGGLAGGGNTDGAATVLLRASTPVDPGNHSVYLSIFDQGDHVVDSAVFLDNLSAGTLLAGQCQPGVIIPPTPTATPTPDVVPPSGSFTINHGALHTEAVGVRLDIVASDPGGNSVEIHLRNNDGSWSDWQAYQSLLTWQLPAINNQTHTVHLQLRDRALNMADVAPQSIFLSFYAPRPASANARLAASTWGSGGLKSSPGYCLEDSTLQAFSPGLLASPTYRWYAGFWGALRPQRVRGCGFDVNCDASFDVLDIQLTAQHWNTTLSPSCDRNAIYDFDSNLRVDVVDIQQVAAHFAP